VTQPDQQQKDRRTPLLLAPPIYRSFNFRKAQDKALLPALKRLRALFHIQGVPVTPPQREMMALHLVRPIRVARAQTYEVTVRYLHGQGFTEDIPPLPDYPVQAVEQALENSVSDLVVGGEPVTESNSAEVSFIEAAQKSTSGAVSRHVQAAARETVQDLADNSGPIVGWARMLTGPSSCSFCAMLASRGPVYNSHDTAIGRGGNPLNLYHMVHLDKKNGKMVGGNCDCIAVPVRRGAPWEGSDAHINLENLWQDATRRKSNADARNAFRRLWDKKVRDGESGEFIADSMKPPGGASTPGG
jgi:hypothetical protein